MKIGILTLPLNTNYGGILQAYALQTVLKRMGHEPYLLKDDRRTDWQYMRLKLICEINRLLKRNDKELDMFHFINKYFTLQLRMDFTSSDDIRKKLKKYSIGQIIVGSDQVWRPEYVRQIENYFLNFLPDDCDVKRMAYAASFGVDDWRFTEQQTKTCAELIKKFSVVTVREASGIKLCNQYLSCDASLVLDPTLLLEKEDYVKIALLEKEKPRQGELFYYILDMNQEKKNLVKRVAGELRLKPFGILLENELEKRPSVSAWLRCFMDAEFVITDSFHGCVFSIIFNKPFIVILNRRRGQSRFESLLGLFNLQDRLIDLDEFEWHLNEFSSIDWDSVNMIKRKMKALSLGYLSASTNN